MRQITQDERVRLHGYLDLSIHKLNSDKNSKKPHWLSEDTDTSDLLLHLRKEWLELGVELMLNSIKPGEADVIDECKDIVNIALMIWDRVAHDKA